MLIPVLTIGLLALSAFPANADYVSDLQIPYTVSAATTAWNDGGRTYAYGSGFLNCHPAILEDHMLQVQVEGTGLTPDQYPRANVSGGSSTLSAQTATGSYVRESYRPDTWTTDATATTPGYPCKCHDRDFDL